MFNTPPPSPAPMCTQVQLVGFGVIGIVVGLALLLWGHKLARVLIVLVGAGVGFAIAGAMSRRIGARLDVTRGVMVFCLATVGLVTSRIAWSVGAAAIAAAVVAVAVLACVDAGALGGPNDAAVGNTGQWACEYGQHVWAALAKSLSDYAIPWSLGIGAASGAVLLVVLVWPRPGQIILTALIGALALLGGAMLLALRFRPEMWLRAFEKPWYALSGVAALLLIGLIVQSLQAVRAARRKAAPPAR